MMATIETRIAGAPRPPTGGRGISIETRIAGIPCIVETTHISIVRADHLADSDWDYTGYSEMEWVVLDRRGRPAPWLQRKVTDEDEERINEEIFNQMETL